MGSLTLVTGGARSGKSTFAELQAKKYADVAYLATSIAFDEGMVHRIKKHREQRPKEWATIEAYKDFLPIRDDQEFRRAELILMDCLTVMITNHMIESGIDFEACTPEEVDELEADIKKEVEDLLDIAKDKEMIIVTNELGMGIVPAYKMGNYFRDIAGRMNQYVASRADHVYFVVSGIEMKIK